MGHKARRGHSAIRKGGLEMSQGWYPVWAALLAVAVLIGVAGPA
jgi:hypothetical protein